MPELQQPEAPEGEEGGSDGEEVLAYPRPLLVFLISKDPKQKSVMDAIEKNVWCNEPLALAARLFDCLQLDGDNLDPEHPLFEAVRGREVPRMAVVSRDRSTSVVIDGKIRASTIYAALRRVGDMEYTTRIEQYVRGMRGLLNELDQFDQQEKRLALAKKRGRASQADIDRLEKTRQELEEQQQKLSQMTLKPLRRRK